MIPWILFTVLLLFTFSKSKLLYLFICIAIVVFSANRYDVGFDYLTYWNMIDSNNFEAYKNEYLSYILMDFSYSLGEPQFYFAITSIFIITAVSQSILKYSKDVNVSLLIFLSIPIFFINTLTIIRQYCALAVIIYSYKFIFNRQFLWFFLCVVISTLFHKASIFAFPLYFLNREISRKITLISFAAAYLSTYLFIEIAAKYFPYYYKFYIENIILGGGDGVRVLLLAFFIIFVFLKDNVLKDKYFNLFFNSYFVGVLLLLILSEYGQASRVAIVYLFPLVILVPYYMDIFKQKTALRLFVIIFFIALFIYTLILGSMNPVKDPNIPYHSYISL